MRKKENFGTVEDYVRAFRAITREGIAESHLRLLQAHARKPIAAWAQLAKRVGYENRNAVQLQYGTLARRVAGYLGVSELPEQGFWLCVLVTWAEKRDRASGHTAFVLRPEVAKALIHVGLVK